MAPSPPSTLEALLERDEGRRRFPYKDSRGFLTIGVGRNLTSRGLSDEEISFLLRNDIRDCEADLDRELPWWRGLDEVRRRVMVSLCFNLGIHTLLTFSQTLPAIRDGRYAEAAKLLLSNHRYVRQIGARAYRFAYMLETGLPA